MAVFSENEAVGAGTDNVRVDRGEDIFWHQENVEERIRVKLHEFAAELQKIKKMREKA